MAGALKKKLGLTITSEKGGRSGKGLCHPLNARHLDAH